jgi:hypothetical protein
MCNKCRATVPDLSLAEAAVKAVGDLVFWRDQTPTELEFGDIPRVAKDVNDSEVAIAESVSGPLKIVVRQLVADAIAAVKSGDPAKVTAIKADDTEVKSAMKDAIGKAITVGKQQVFDQYRAQTGNKLALPPRVRPKLTAKIITSKSAAQAEHLVGEARAAAQKVALEQIGRDAYDADLLEAFVVSKSEELLKTMAREDAREANGLGRLMAAEDTKADIESVMYTAIMDNGVCSVCQDQDGDEYGPDDMGKAPNPNCEGALYAGCRCAELIIYKKG